jgi:predicted nucleotidyltransferase component of viral defense system
MIDRLSLSTQWINHVSAQKRLDKILVEKCIRALFLLEGLAKIELDFIFKGGTALFLLLDSPKRLSIDIDILLKNEPVDLISLFQELVSEQLFNRFGLQTRKSDPGIAKAHYKFYYTPVHKTNAQEEYILLDILFQESPYQQVSNVELISDFIISSDKNFTIPIPSAQDLLGDKMTAFAPNTTGIPYYKNNLSMSMEIIKQLYDISNLFEILTDLQIVEKTFRTIAATELKYRGLNNVSPADVLNDIIDTALCISSRGKAGSGNYEDLQKGISRVSGYIFSESFHLEKAITAASKVAYLAAAIRKAHNSLEKYSDSAQMNDWVITQSLWSRVNRLKRSNPEAYFYWYKMHELIQDEKASFRGAAVFPS